jgi:glycosyltransferase involved in cell wall biosynthesis
LTKYLSDDFEIRMIGGQKDDFEESSEFILTEMGIEYTILESMRRKISFKYDRAAYKEIKNIIKEFKPDIVHTHAAKAGAIGRLAAHKMNVPVIVHTFHGHVFHSYFGFLKTKFFIFLERYLAKKTSQIITLSEQQNHEICGIHKICAKEKTSIVPNGIGLDYFKKDKVAKRKLFRQEWGIPENTIAIGIVGRVVPIKDHSFFLKTFKETKLATNRKIKGVIIGDGDQMEFAINEAKRLGLSISTKDDLNSNSDLLFTSWIKSIDCANAALDIMCLTSLNEGTPVSLVEAQASGLPVISTNVGGVKDIIVNGKSGTLVEPNDLSNFTKNLTELVENEELRLNMGKYGEQFVFKKFHYKTFCSQMENIYYNLLKESNHN